MASTKDNAAAAATKRKPKLDFTQGTPISIVVGEEEECEEFRVNELVLADASAVFAQMFASDCAEASSKRVSLPQISPDAFRQFLILLHFDREASQLKSMGASYDLTNGAHREFCGDCSSDPTVF